MRAKRILFGLLAFAILTYLLRFVWLPPIASWLNVSDPRLPVDYVIPLPGGNDDRPFAAAALVRAGLADQVAVVVNDLTPNVADGIVSPMHQVTRQVLLLRGVPADDILMLKGTSSSTYSDIRIIGQLFGQQPNATIAIVTAPSHTRRVRWTVNRGLSRYRDQICVIAAFNDSYEERIWWQSQSGLKATLSEYLKLIFYWLTYSSSRQRAVVLGIIFAVVIVLIRLIHRRRSQTPNAASHAADRV